MENKIMETIKKRNMIAPGDFIIVAFSGGADSSALLRFLYSVKDTFNITLLAAHVNHGLRGGESDEDELFCVRTCMSYGIPCTVCRADVKLEAMARRVSVEEAGRVLRYEFFEKTAARYGAKIAVAHNKNDNAETILHNLIRGAGPGGIAGIPPVRGNIVRPLIDCLRIEIEAYCRDNKIKFRNDSSNSSVLYTRNKIRRELIPYLASAYNPSVVDAVVTCGALVSEDAAYINGRAETALGACRAPGGAVDINKLKTYGDVIIKRVLRTVYAETGGTLKDFTYSHTEALINLLNGQSGKAINLPGGVEARKDYSQLIFSLKKKNSEKTEDFCYNLVYNTDVFVKELNIYVYITKNKPDDSDDYERLSVNMTGDTVYFRSRLPGDRIYFNSIGGHKKIKGFFNEKRVSVGLRNQIGMFARGNDILWIPSMRVKSDKYLNGGETVYAGVRRGDDHRRGN